MYIFFQSASVPGLTFKNSPTSQCPVRWQTLQSDTLQTETLQKLPQLEKKVKINLRNQKVAHIFATD